MSDASRQAPSHLSRPQGTASAHLDALRGVAAVGVCLSHLRDFFFEDYPKLPHHNPLLAAAYLVTGLGHQWVIVFFVLSGYLVGGSVLRSAAVDRWSWRGYLLNRLTRLYAVLVPALVFGGVLDLAGSHIFGTAGIYGGNTVAHELGFAVRSRLSVPIMIGNYAFLQGMYVPTFGSNSPLWSLANEFWYYIAFPFMVCALWPRLSAAKRLLNVALLVAVLAFVHPQIAIMGLIWLMGVAIHYLPRLPIEVAFVRRLSIPAAVVVCSAVLVWCKLTRFAGADYVLGIAVAALMYAVLSCSRTSMPSAYNWTAEVLSRSSYTLYLVHVPFLVFLAAWIGQARWVPTPGHVLIGCAIFAIVMLYAQLVWFFFEKRTDALRNWIRPRSSAPDLLKPKLSDETKTEVSVRL